MAGAKICFRCALCAVLGKLTLTLTRPAGGQTDSVDGPTAFGLLLVACVVGVVATDDELMCVSPLQIVAFNRIW